MLSGQRPDADRRAGDEARRVRLRRQAVRRRRARNPLAQDALKQRQLSQEVASLREGAAVAGPLPRCCSAQASAWRRSRTSSIEWPTPTSRCSFAAKAAPARSWWRGRCSASSLRRDKPFVKVNCAALPTELLESELFGYERGAFTGAIQQKPGKFEFANHGTHLSRRDRRHVAGRSRRSCCSVLQDGEFSRLGGTHDMHVDVRIVAATNRDLEQRRRRRPVPGRPLLPAERRSDHRCRRCASGAKKFRMLTDHFLKKYSVQYQQAAAPSCPTETDAACWPNTSGRATSASSKT